VPGRWDAHDACTEAPPLTLLSMHRETWKTILKIVVLLLIPSSVIAYEPKLPSWTIQAVRDIYRSARRAHSMARGIPLHFMHVHIH
jgi:hypothetical protein